MIFSKFTENWFIYDRCPYIQSILARGRHFTKSSANSKRSRLINKMLPYFKKLKMEDITHLHIEEWITLLKKEKKSNTTINLYLADLKSIFKEAYRTDVIKSNPGLKVNNLANDSKTKSTLKEHEVIKLLNPDTKENIWSANYAFIINLIASKTGMRMAEIQALKQENIHEDHIVVKYSWERNYGLKCPKNGKTRIVPIGKKLYIELNNFIQNNSKEFDYVFSKKDGISPITHTSIHYETNKAFDKIGITKEIRKKRNITFHSWRHYCNTQLLKQGVPKLIIQTIIGHSSDKMTEHYTKLTKDDLVNAIANR